MTDETRQHGERVRHLRSALAGLGDIRASVLAPFDFDNIAVDWVDCAIDRFDYKSDFGGYRVTFTVMHDKLPPDVRSALHELQGSET
ncbi:hypothetical protein [Candidatus Poriferisodalis multihospitum]|uniref:hypothetical protein n=1 Tax=Candidatus Poriferisodalis multihospitum TaxID=2983191 RepID=UPI002B25875B|nr:hypothetical protein [Candidatus Poriferisodalis multihospitum]